MNESATGASDSVGKVLLVDDDVDAREAIAETLEDRGFTVATATNGLDALRFLRTTKSPPEVILLDLMMPVLDGYGFLDARHKEPALEGIPVVVITAGYKVDRARLGEAIPVVPKPIKLEQLMSTLRRMRVGGTAS